MPARLLIDAVLLGAAASLRRCGLHGRLLASLCLAIVSRSEAEGTTRGGQTDGPKALIAIVVWTADSRSLERQRNY